MRRILPLVVAVAALAAACSGSSTTSSADDAASSTPATDTADDPGSSGWPHDFTATAIDGTAIDAGDYEGQDLVLWFWAPW